MKFEIVGERGQGVSLKDGAKCAMQTEGKVCCWARGQGFP